MTIVSDVFTPLERLRIGGTKHEIAYRLQSKLGVYFDIMTSPNIVLVDSAIPYMMASDAKSYISTPLKHATIVILNYDDQEWKNVETANGQVIPDRESAWRNYLCGLNDLSGIGVIERQSVLVSTSKIPPYLLYNERVVTYLTFSNPNVSRGFQSLSIVVTDYKTREELVAAVDKPYLKPTFYRHKLYISRDMYDSIMDNKHQILMGV